MISYSRLPDKFQWLIPALSLAALGTYDILSDLLDHSLLVKNLLFNTVFFLPLLLRYRIVYVIVGAACTVLFMYIFIVLLAFLIQFLGGSTFMHAQAMFGLGLPLSLFYILCSLLLILRGTTHSKTT